MGLAISAGAESVQARIARKCAEFHAEADRIAQMYAAYHDVQERTAVFWSFAHNPHASVCNYDGERNKELCITYRAANREKIFMIDDVQPAANVLDAAHLLYKSTVPAHTPFQEDANIRRSWEICSRGYAMSVTEGSDIIVAGNDPIANDCLIEHEWPVLLEKNIGMVTALQPCGVDPEIFEFADWHERFLWQKRNPGHFLDRTPYPPGCV